MFIQTRHKRLFSELTSSQTNANPIKPIQRMKTSQSQVQPNANTLRFMKTNFHIRNQSNIFQNSKKANARFQIQKAITSQSEQKMQKVKQKMQNNPKNYKLKTLIGHGTFGKVFNAYSLKIGKQVAVKKIYQDQKYHNRELQVLKSLNHPNVIKLLDYYYEHELNLKYLHIVMNIYETDLYNLARRAKIQCDLTKIYLFQILKGLEYLKSISIAHRDLKPHNILINSSTNQAVICDFGSAKKLFKFDKNISYICARSYRAPQLALGSTDYTTAIDMWSFGCIAAEISNGKLLFHANSNIEHFVQIMKVLGTPTQQQFLEMNAGIDIQSYTEIKKINKRPLKYFLNIADQSLVDLIQHILVYSPSKRYTPTQALNHPYFDSLKKPQNFRYSQMYGNLSSNLHDQKKGSLIVTKAKMSSFGQDNQKHLKEIHRLQKIIVPNINLRKHVKSPQQHS